MKGVKVASRYAKSLIDLAVEQDSLDSVYADMVLVNGACKSNHDFLLMLHNPIIKTDKKKSILNSVFAGKVSEVSLKFIHLITEKKREMFIPEIADSFVRQYKHIRKIKSAEIITAAPLNEKIRTDVLEIVKNFTHTEVELYEKVNPEIIGGYILTVDDQQDDTSIKTKIGKLRRTFKENLYLKDY